MKVLNSKKVIWVTTELILNTSGDYYAAKKLCANLKKTYGDDIEIILFVINLDQSNVPKLNKDDKFNKRIVLNKEDISSNKLDSILSLDSNESIPDMIIRCAKFDSLDKDKYDILFNKANNQDHPPVILNITEYNSDNGSNNFSLGTTLVTGINPSGTLSLGVELAPTAPEATFHVLHDRLSEDVKKLIKLNENSAVILGYLATNHCSLNCVEICEYVDTCLKLIQHKPYERLVFLLPFNDSLLKQISPIVERYGYQLGQFTKVVENQPVNLNPNKSSLSKKNKIIDFINPFPLAHQDMITLQQISDKVVKLRLTTGDQSAMESSCTNGINFYQIMPHKERFFDESFLNYAKEILGDNSLLFRFYQAIKPCVPYDSEFIGELLKDQKIYDEAKFVWDKIRKNFNLKENLPIVIDLLILARNASADAGDMEKKYNATL